MSVRNLQGIVTLNGVSYRVLDMDVSMTSAQSSDTLNATIAMDEYPGASEALISAGGISVEASVVAGADGGDLFTGDADHITADFATRTISISARDKSQGPIDKKSIEGFRNKTPQQIVSEIAGRNGLAPVISGAGSDFAGKIFNIDHVLLTDHISEWTLVQHLADREGMVSYVQKNKLHFEPLDAGSQGKIAIVYVPPTPANCATGNFMRLTCDRDLQIGKGGEVTVNSWNTKSKKGFTGKAQHPGSVAGAPNIWNYRHPQLKQGQAKRIAEKRLRENTRQELTIDLDMPGRASIVPRVMIGLTGTGTIFDQDYYIDNARHQIGRGYRVQITAKNSLGGKGGG